MTKPSAPAEYARFKSSDPFPSIPPALLNSADISDYACKLKLIDPFEHEKLKPASYEVPFAGTIYWWDPATKKRHEQEVDAARPSFEVQSNAIVYVYLKTTFHLPDYIAMRFNLQIREVHRGLLLGTGPLVDPGFCGRLLIPLHNLTANRYHLEFGDGFIWVEFTKLSPVQLWTSKTLEIESDRTGVFRQFSDKKLFLTASDYFAKANANASIVSSIPDAMEGARGEAKSAATAARTAASQSVLITLLTVVSLAVGGWQFVSFFETAVINMLDSKIKASDESLKRQLEEARRELDKVNEEISSLKKGMMPAPAKADKGVVKKNSGI